MEDRINKYWSNRSKEFSYARRLDLTTDVHDKWITIIKKHLPEKKDLRALDLGSSATKRCGCGGIGRHDRFRFYWETVQVQVLSPALFKGSSS